MAVVNVNIKYLENKTKLKKEKIKEILELIGFPAEFQEGNFWIEITPDRPDCYLVQGIIRAIESFNGKKNKKYISKKSDYVLNVEKNVHEVRPYISSCVVKNVKITDEEIEQLIDAQEKMHETSGRKRKKFAIGIHDYDVVEFPIKYSIVKEYEFVPLEFSEKMTMTEMLEKHPKGKEYAHLVEKGKYPLIYEEKSGKVISFPPIINEDRTKLTKKTRNIFIELTGMHKETVENAVTNLACTLSDMGGEIYQVKIGKEIHPKLEYKKEKIKAKEINKILGTELKEKEIENSLKKMGYFILKNAIEIPPYRGDVIAYIDIVEDVAIGYGYENFEPKIPNFYTTGKFHENSIKEKNIREIFNGMGFLEVVTPILVSGEDANKEALKVLNPCSKDYEFVKQSMFGSLMDILNKNKMKGIPQKIYEIGRVYSGKEEKRKTAFALMDKKADFNSIRSYLQTYAKEIGIKIKIENKKDERFESNKCGKIVSNKKEIGIVGEVNKKFLEKHGIEFSVCFCEMEI